MATRKYYRLTIVSTRGPHLRIEEAAEWLEAKSCSVEQSRFAVALAPAIARLAWCLTSGCEQLMADAFSWSSLPVNRVVTT